MRGWSRFIHSTNVPCEPTVCLVSSGHWGDVSEQNRQTALRVTSDERLREAREQALQISGGRASRRGNSWCKGPEVRECHVSEEPSGSPGKLEWSEGEEEWLGWKVREVMRGQVVELVGHCDALHFYSERDEQCF